MPDTCIIVNPGSGKRRGEALRNELEQAARSLPGQVVVRSVRRGAELVPTTGQAVREGFGTVVAAGGDGTINAVATQLVGTGCRLGVLPLGTFNYVARRFGIPLDLPGALRTAVTGQPRSIDVGEVNGRVFLNNASLGAYAAILGQREQTYRRWGRSRLAAHWSVLLGILRFREPLRLTLTVDGVVSQHRTPMVFVASNSYQLEQLKLAGADCIDKHQLALFLAPDTGRFALLRLAIGLPLAWLRPQRDFQLFCGQEILVQTQRHHRTIARDGERERLAGPFRFRMRRDALQVMVPADT